MPFEIKSNELNSSQQEIPMATPVVPENESPSFSYEAYANTSSGGSQHPPSMTFGAMCTSQENMVISGSDTEESKSPITPVVNPEDPLQRHRRFFNQGRVYATREEAGLEDARMKSPLQEVLNKPSTTPTLGGSK